MKQPSNPSQKVQVIDRAAEVLAVLSHHPDGLTLTELTQATGLHKATALRFLKSLEQNGFAEKEGSGKFWGLGPAIFEMASRASRRNDLRELARPVMEAISAELGETVQLAILVGNEIVYVEKIEPENLALKINTQIGSRRPIHCTALGKVICADMDWSRVRAMLDSAGMAAQTPQTITDPERFGEELRKVRESGYAVDDREYNNLVACAAAPVRNASGIVAGLSVSSLGIAADSARFAALVDAIKAGAERLSEKLGYKRHD